MGFFDWLLFGSTQEAKEPVSETQIIETQLLYDNKAKVFADQAVVARNQMLEQALVKAEELVMEQAGALSKGGRRSFCFELFDFVKEFNPTIPEDFDLELRERLEALLSKKGFTCRQDSKYCSSDNRCHPRLIIGW